MAKTKFYALYNGTRKEKHSGTERVFDKKSGKRVQKQVEREVSVGTSYVFDLLSETRIGARQEALAIAREEGLKFAGLHLYK
ncbi:hypothetical protein LaPh949_gp122 [Lactococcus phage 949]|uniref:Uncharacterized protein n=1 Tax=Lactococcus phage 949 TaxID=881953 RepID=E0YJ09_9CAUD|nr:hypothetical protein LaPh949_gp122 [Lactococcus phage 949]ADM73680.1 hypothetical protein [Lactococcus phage 949]